MTLTRRSLLLSAAAAPAASLELPTIKLGKYSVSRLIAGNNPMGGFSHSVPKLSAIMKNWFTQERSAHSSSPTQTSRKPTRSLWGCFPY